MDKTTDDWVGRSFTGLAMASFLAAIAPFARYLPLLEASEIGRITVHWTVVFCEWAFVSVQLSTSKHWRGGVPHAFRKSLKETT